jgi:hypothetical protein
MGSHFGGINQAQTFGSNVGKYVLNISNPLRVEDMGVFDPLNVASQMVDAGIIDDKFIDIVERQSSKDAIKLVQKELQYLGYDGLVYVNRREGVDVSESDRGTFDMEATDAEFVERYPDASESYVVFSPNQIKSADPVTYDSAGNVIPLSQRFDAGRDEISYSMGAVPEEIANSTDPIVKHIFLKEDGKFYQKMKDGYVIVDQSLDEFEGMAIMLHQPDGAMSGTVEVDGDQVVDGKGGVYYPVMFGDQGYFWASTRDAAHTMAKSLNAISKRNNGTILMA